LASLRSVVRVGAVVWTFAMGFFELLITRPKTPQARADWLHRFCALAAKRFGISIEVTGKFPERGALISNHLSYVDIVVFAAIHPCAFVSKAEIARWPVVGWMTTMAGTVYVERGRGGSAERARAGMQATANAGVPMVFFPEGTTTNGETGMLKFHSGLLAQAMSTGEEVTGAYVHYSLGGGNDAEASVANDICFWGDETMWPHMFRFMNLRNVRAQVRFGDGPIRFSNDVLHRKQAAAEAREAVLRLAQSGAVTEELHHF
jgi:1-acyl-sn-glycerol-3-phosphate acyltransferase